MYVNRDKVVAAANRLEELAPILKEMVVDFRDGTEPDPYASVYWLRRELTRIVSGLGYGQPSLTRFADGDWESQRVNELTGE